jgi:hypothetical protein
LSSNPISERISEAKGKRMPHVRPYSRALPKTLLIIAVLALAARAQTVLPDTAAADRLKGTVESFSDFLLKYFVALAAVGALSMALIELWKKIRDSQTRFHARVMTEWFQEYSSPGAFAELLHLATGMDPDSAQKAAGDLFGNKGSLPHWFGQSWMQSDALFALDLDRMMGHIQNAADLTLNLPSLYPRLYAVITEGSRPGDAEAWKSMADAPAREDISAAESKQRADLYARLHQVAKTKLDALQLYAGREWVNWNQRWANIVGVAVMLGCLLWLAKHGQVEASPLAILALSAFGGILSPVAKDIVIALKKVRNG